MQRHTPGTLLESRTLAHKMQVGVPFSFTNEQIVQMDEAGVVASDSATRMGRDGLLVLMFCTAGVMMG